MVDQYFSDASEYQVNIRFPRLSLHHLEIQQTHDLYEQKLLNVFLSGITTKVFTIGFGDSEAIIPGSVMPI